jgi:uncharacterized protein YjbJ (UPF0337 family)
MTILEIKGDWNITKGKLRQKEAHIPYDKFQWIEGMSEELLARIQQHISKTREAIKTAVK